MKHTMSVRSVAALLLVLALLTLGAFALTACSSESGEDGRTGESGGTATDDTVNPGGDSTGDENDGDATPGDTQPDNSPSGGSVSLESVSIHNVKITVHEDVAPILAALGNGYEYRESDSCAFVGKDKQYIYQGFVIFTYPDGNTDRVSTVALTSDAVTTGDGLYIGASISKAKAVFGDALQAEGENYALESDRVQILVLTKDGEITSLQYIAKH